MHVLSRVTLSSIFRSCGDRDRVLPTSVGVADFLRILAARASVIRIHSSCRGVSVLVRGNGDTFAACGEGGAGNRDVEGAGESGRGVDAVEDGSGMVATRMTSPDRDWNSSMSSGACKSVSSTQESCAGE